MVPAIGADELTGEENPPRTGLRAGDSPHAVNRRLARYAPHAGTLRATSHVIESSALSISSGTWIGRIVRPSSTGMRRQVIHSNVGGKLLVWALAILRPWHSEGPNTLSLR
jgi:hypothetical protein